jgi:heme exporter protein A
VTVDFDRVAAVQVGRHYGRRRALTDISFTAAAGDIVGLLGPNGAGKSTLLAVLGTLLAASTGRVEYGGRTADDGDAASVRARIGMLGHDLFLYPELTAHENLVFFGRLYGVADAPARAHEALARAGLDARAGDAVSSLSRGMRQRVALERALLHRPRLLLLDEPFTGLDQTSAAALVARLHEEQARGVVTVLATHDLDVVDGLLTATLFLRGGRQVAAAAGGALRDRYRGAMQSA